MSKSTLGSILLVLLFFSVSGQEPIELIFTTQNNSEYVPFDTVYIENMTQDCDTALIYPDTVLSLDIPTGIFEKAIETSGFELTQTGPNPMAGHTNFTVTLSDKAEVYFAVSDLNGRNFFNQRKMMNSGIHSFRFFPGNNNFYILSVQVDQFSKSLKMLNDTRYSYPSSTCVLEYLGRKDHVKRFKSSFNKNDFVFNQGDLLIYTVHSDSGERKISDRPLENQTYTFHYSGTPCPGMSYVWDVDTNVYNTVMIHNQCWMKENLKTTRYKSGDPIPNVPDTTWPDIEYGAYAWYYNNVHWSYSYGALYNWYAVDDTNGLCPEGWKVPSNGGDFYSLKLYAESLSPNYGSSEVLKSCRQVNVFFGGLCNTTEHPRWDTDSQHYGFDLLGFSGMPGGLRFADGSFNQLGGYGYWWTSNPVTSAEDESYFWYMIFFTSQFSSYNYNNHSGFSVRCIKDD